MTEAYNASLSAETIRDSALYNKDLAPISTDRRTWRTYNYAALWISMSVNIPTYMLASAMIAGGMNWKQALFTVFLGNLLVLIPMLLNAHAGAQYGIPFPVFARASFGVLGANVPAILRASGGVRLVRHPDVDRRGSHQRDDRRAGSGVGALRWWRGVLLSFFLAAKCAGHSAGHRDHPLFAGQSPRLFCC